VGDERPERAASVGSEAGASRIVMGGTSWTAGYGRLTGRCSRLLGSRNLVNENDRSSTKRDCADEDSQIQNGEALLRGDARGQSVRKRQRDAAREPTQRPLLST